MVGERCHVQPIEGTIVGFSENIERLMSTRGLTQEDIAKAAKVTPAAETGWMRGSIPRPRALKNLCDAFKVSRDDLLSEDHGLATTSETEQGSALSAKVPLVSKGEGASRIHSRISVPEEIVRKHPHAYAIVARDEGMNHCIPTGSHVLIDPELCFPPNGSIVALKVLDYLEMQKLNTLLGGHDEILLRVWYKGANNLMLSPCCYNRALEDIILGIDDISTAIDVLGTVVWFQASTPPSLGVSSVLPI